MIIVIERKEGFKIRIGYAVYNIGARDEFCYRLISPRPFLIGASYVPCVVHRVSRMS